MHGKRCDDSAAMCGGAKAEHGLDHITVVARERDGEPVERLRERPPCDPRIRRGDGAASLSGEGLRGEPLEQRGEEPRLLGVQASPQQLGAVAL